ncbi:hypothetical protein B0T25DRAFT_514352 [Lasiosphaeria hispida]|uniref:Helicase C-terminal domain-containing protein n=1 Tax=Lasiosphaeria hispida TaxID=260671 RepID=A0AAJ0MH70_9PEZI|nr:hypothetical protein B0T25DRAFT_514352 [Lasiosphaeria hispida]
MPNIQALQTIVDHVRNSPRQSRDAVMAAWNSSSTLVDVLVLNSAVSSLGLNAHLNCSTGIGLSFVWNAATVTQYIGRLFRIGQTKIVKWSLLYIKGTISYWQMERMCRKFVHEVAPRWDIPGIHHPKLKLLFGYEILRLMFTHSFNRFSWYVEPPQSVQDYTSERATILGKVYSGLVHLIQTCPLDLTNSTNKENWKAMETVVEFIGPAFIDLFYTQSTNTVGETIYTPIHDIDQQDPNITWERIYKMFPYIKEHMGRLLGPMCKPPIGEPERDQAAFRQRAAVKAKELGVTVRDIRYKASP